MKRSIPLLEHDLNATTAFSPEDLVAAVRTDKHLEPEPTPPVCILEFDGDLTDWLVATGKAKPWKSWACFHTTMFSLEVDGFTCGIVPRTIGGPYAVLIAEQMRVSGARVVLGLTSAGRVSPSMPLPGLVVVTRAIRDEGTSYHYLPPAETVEAPPKLTHLLESELMNLPLPVLSGVTWTTDAPYRETERQLSEHAKAGVLAVEMQAASLLAFAEAHRFPVGIVAYVTNGVGQAGEPFDKGTRVQELEVLMQTCKAGKRFVSS
jgi:uridine phosphorylase